MSARSVKLLDRIHHPEESETRDAWWVEVRTEVRSHCKALACNVVLGYEETTTIWLAARWAGGRRVRHCWRGLGV